MFSMLAMNTVGSETNNRYRRKITVDNSGNAETLTDYQVFLNVTHDSDMQPDFDDLRFTWYNEASGQEVSIDYWLDKYVNSEYALIWAEVPSIKGLGQEVLYVYYGDPEAVSGSNGEETFVFFDDFSTDTTSNYEVWYNPEGKISWDPNGWLFVNASIRQAPGRASNVHVRHKTVVIDATEEKFWLETKGKASGSGVLDHFRVSEVYKTDSQPTTECSIFAGVSGTHWSRPWNVSQLTAFWGYGSEVREFSEDEKITTAVKDKWLRIGLGTSPSGTVIGSYYDNDYNEISTLVNQTFHQDNKWWVDVVASRGETDTWATLYVYFDYIRVRKFTDPELSCLIGREEPLPTVDIDPDTLNLKSSGQWITAYIELPEGYSVNNIDVDSILINNTIPVDVEAPTTIGDYDLDNILDLMVKFDRAGIIQWLDAIDHGEDTGKYYEINLTITGTVAGIPFSATDKIKMLTK